MAQTTLAKMKVIRIVAWPAFRTRNVNPYNALLYEHVRAAGCIVEDFSLVTLLAGRCDIWHLHWPEDAVNRSGFTGNVVRLIALSVLLIWTRMTGVKVVWTVHNLRPHQSRHPLLQLMLRRVLLRVLDGYISLSEAGVTLIEKAYPRLKSVKSFVIPHGHYRDLYRVRDDRDACRARLGLDRNCIALAFVGQVRSYKNVPKLLSTFSGLHGTDLRLVIAGSCSDDALREQIARLAREDARVLLKLEFLGDRELEEVVSAVDLIVLPYNEILNSGAALLALSLERPVLVPRMGALPELQLLFGPTWVRMYDGDLTGPDLERNARMATKQIDESAFNALRDALERIAWPRIAALTVAAYASLLGILKEVESPTEPARSLSHHRTSENSRNGN